MKPISYTLVIMMLHLELGFSQVPSNCAPTTFLETAYRADVNEMALTRIYGISSPDTSLLQIPEVHLDSVQEGLAAIFNCSLPERDTIFDIFCLHDHIAISETGHLFSLQIDPLEAWTTNWQNSILLSGDQELDSMLMLGQFQLLSYSQSTNTAVLRPTVQINPNAMASFLLGHSGVLGLQYGLVNGDGSTIRYQVINGLRIYTFRLGCGDCPSGCTAFIRWKFSVSADCSVTLVERASYAELECLNDPSLLCIGTGIEVRDEETIGPKIFPNPTSGSFRIFHDDKTRFSELRIVDAVGKVIFQGMIKEIDTSSWKNGIYQVILEAENHMTYTGRLLVQH